MTEGFLHGVRVVEIDDGPRPIRTVESSVIGLVGTAHTGPINTPVLIAGSRTAAAKMFGGSGGGFTIPDAFDAIFDQIGAMVVAINVFDPARHRTAVAPAVMAFDAAGSIALAHRLVTSVTVAGPIEALLPLAGAPGTITLPATAAGITVRSSDGATLYASPADYTVAEGVVTRVPAGTIPDGATLQVTYTAPLVAGTDYTVDEAAGVVTHRVAGAIPFGAKVTVGYAWLDPTQVSLADVVGGVDAVTGHYTGVHALLASQSEAKVQPRILVAPGFTHLRPLDAGEPVANPVVAEMVGIAERLRAVIIADGPNTTDTDAIDWREDFGSARVYVVDPWCKVLDTSTSAVAHAPASARVAGLIAKSDNERGFWWSPSNTELVGCLGPARPVDFTLGDPNCRANVLNGRDVATIIHMDGYRLWGNRTCSSDPKWAFLSVRRTADMVNDSLQRAHLWAVDRNITRTYVQDVVEGVNDYLRHLTKIGAILGGQCWADPELNAPDQISQGRVYFDFDFTPPYPAENITFRSRLVDNYIVDVFKI